MPGRSFNSGDYRYGMNGQEQDEEIFEGAYTAEYWEYDSRIGRRWNTDPVVKPWESPYATFRNNPIFYADPTGLDGEPLNGGSLGEVSVSAEGNTSSPQAVQAKLPMGPEGELGLKGYSGNTDRNPSSSLSAVTTNPNAPNLTVGNINLRVRAGTVEAPKSGFTEAGIVLVESPTSKNPIGVIATGIILAGALMTTVPDVDVYVPTISDAGVTNDDPSDPYIMLYRGVYVGHPAYPEAVFGAAVPGGDVMDPSAHNSGNPIDIARSGFTAWTEYPTVAFQMAIRKETGGVILAKAFKLSYIMHLMSNPLTASPDKYKQGEILIPGTVTGAIPVPVPPIPK